MIKHICEYIELIFNVRKYKALFSKGGYLYDNGWKKSIWNKMVINEQEAIPWLTYSFIRFIELRLNKRMKVLEYGSGYSTLWWASKCGSILSIETSDEWFDYVSKITKDTHNVSIVKRDNDTDIVHIDDGYDIVIVDNSGDRNRNVKESLDLLSKNGVLVLDDSERYEYEEGINYLISKGFRKLDFEGLAPMIQYSGKMTSVFYRVENVLNI